MNKINLALTMMLLAGASVFSANASAELNQPDITVMGTRQIPVMLHTDMSRSNGTMQDGSPIKTITVPMIKLSPEALGALQERLTDIENDDQQPTVNQNSALMATSQSSSAVNLGMNGVPVLDQGSHGTCVTFAVSEALDAGLYSKDYVSQLCSLELGSYLKTQNKYYSSGWEGSFASRVLAQFKQYGVVNKDIESQRVCGGLSHYPARSSTTGSPLAADAYSQYSESISGKIKVHELLSASRAFSRYTDRDALITKIKQQLDKGNRVAVGLGLDPGAANAGFVGHNVTYNDSWIVSKVLKEKIRKKEYNDLGYHEVLIHGYDDDVVINHQKGAFKLRNSWGKRFGDKGDAYVTYEYVKLLMTEANGIEVTNK